MRECCINTVEPQFSKPLYTVYVYSKVLGPVSQALHALLQAYMYIVTLQLCFVFPELASHMKGKSAYDCEK